MQEMTTNDTPAFFTETDTEKAFQIARQQQLPVLVDFWAPGCKGCRKMENTTYTNAETLSCIQQHFVFIKYDITNRSAVKITSSPVLWTPTFIVFANDGSEVRKITGYLNDTQFKAEIEIARALACLRKAKPGMALDILETFLEAADPEIYWPEVLYWAGVASYFLNQRNSESLVMHWKKLLAEYPESIWTARADCLNVEL